MRRLSILLIVLLVAPVAVSSAARDRKPPRIVAAALLDTNGDYRADRVRLIFSERIRHPRDVDRTYPFVVAGYRIASAGAARGKAIEVVLAEKAEADAGPARRSAMQGRASAPSAISPGTRR